MRSPASRSECYFLYASSTYRSGRTDERLSLSCLQRSYLSNATNDLVMMALWSLVVDKMGGTLLPSYQFGRDDRIYK